MLNDTDFTAILEGKNPVSDETLVNLSAGFEPLINFWSEKYLDEYIRCGGSKIRFVTGKRGSGKTHFMRRMEIEAGKRGYAVVSFSARNVWLNDFRDIYLEAYRQCDIKTILNDCAKAIIKGVGYNPEDIPEEMSFSDYLAGIGENDALTKRTVLMEIRNKFVRNPLMDNNFAMAVSLLVGGVLGCPELERQDEEVLTGWLNGDKTIKTTVLRACGLAPSHITKLNARYMLRSLSEVLRISGRAGLYVSIDDLDILCASKGTDTIEYKKVRREDTYESIRQLIDDIDMMRSVMFVFAFDRKLIDDDSSGIKSYQALWMRIQNEVAGEAFNYFADITELDRYEQQEMKSDILSQLAAKLTETFSEVGIDTKRIEEDAFELMRSSAKNGSTGLPLVVVRNVLEVSENV